MIANILWLIPGSFAYFMRQYGGTNPVMLKAMSNNCAILALDTAFNREMLDNGKFGLFFDANENSLTEAINKLESNNNLTDVMRKNVSLGLNEKYNRDSVTNKYKSAHA